MTILPRSGSPWLQAGALVGSALLLPAVALAQPVIIERTVQTVEYLDDGSRYPNQRVTTRPYGRKVALQPVQPAYQQPAYPQQVYAQPGYPQPTYRAVNPAYAQPYRQAYAPPVTVVDAQQQERSCQIGRLVGGLVGGGIGYAASRQDGRTWAVPLGALLGTQAGCNTAVGKGPVLW